MAGIDRNWRELIIETLIRLAGISTILIVGLIFLFLLREGLPTFLDIPLRQLFGEPLVSERRHCSGLWPLIVGIAAGHGGRDRDRRAAGLDDGDLSGRNRARSGSAKF